MTQDPAGPEVLTVIQADRDAAAGHWFRTVEAADANFAVGHHLRTGKADHNELVQAFARHRLNTSPDKALIEALEKCVAVIEKFRSASLLAEGVHVGLRRGTDAPDAGVIWNAISRSSSTAWSDAIAFALDPYFTMWGGDAALSAARTILAQHQSGESA